MDGVPGAETVGWKADEQLSAVAGALAGRSGFPDWKAPPVPVRLSGTIAVWRMGGRRGTLEGRLGGQADIDR